MTLINIIVKSYSSILLAIGSAAGFCFVLGSYLIIRMSRSKTEEIVEEVEAQPAAAKQPHAPRKARKASHKSAEKSSEKAILTETLNDVNAISGEDPVATQLDLAKAYIESGKGQLAKIILTSVIRNGNEDYQEEAQRLLSSI